MVPHIYPPPPRCRGEPQGARKRNATLGHLFVPFVAAVASVFFLLVLWVVKPPRPPHHRKPRQGHEPDDAHSDPDADADLVTGAERPIAWC